jgi:hypothetical protein
VGCILVVCRFVKTNLRIGDRERNGVSAESKRTKERPDERIPASAATRERLEQLFNGQRLACPSQPRLLTSFGEFAGG